MSSVASACILSGQGQLCRHRKGHRGKEGPCRQQAGSKLRGLRQVGTAHPVARVCLLKLHDAVWEGRA